MNVLFQRHCARYIYVVPQGLRELMSDISREVLRSQPEQMYTFIADYLDALLITRENARVAAKFVQSITQIATTVVDLLIRTGMTREEADRVCTIIQTAFRKHLAIKAAAKQNEQVEEANIISEILDEAEISPEQAEAAAIVIQTAYRKFKARQECERELLTGMIDWRVAARSAIQLYRKTGVTTEEAKRAATLIKAAYKGYYTRRMMRRLVEEGQRLYAEEAPGEDQSIMEYLRQLEWESGGEYDDIDESEHLRKSVRINYDTVIPHVDFSDATVIEDREGEPSATTIVKGIMTTIISDVIPDDFTETDITTTETTLISLSELPDDQSEIREPQSTAEAHVEVAPHKGEQPPEIHAEEAPKEGGEQAVSEPAAEAQPAEEHPAEVQAEETAPAAEAEPEVPESPPQTERTEATETTDATTEETTE